MHQAKLGSALLDTRSANRTNQTSPTLPAAKKTGGQTIQQWFQQAGVDAMQQANVVANIVLYAQ